MILSNVTLNGRLSLQQGAGAPPAPTSQWTTAGTPGLWDVSGNIATTSNDRIAGNQVLYGPLLPAGTYVDVFLQTGYDGTVSKIAFLGVTDNLASQAFIYSTTSVKYVAWYWAGSTWVDGAQYGVTPPSQLVGQQRYRIASKAGGAIYMSKVSADGSTLIGSPIALPMSSGFIASELKLMILPQPGYTTVSATVYSVNPGSGGL